MFSILYVFLYFFQLLVQLFSIVFFINFLIFSSISDKNKEKYKLIKLKNIINNILKMKCNLLIKNCMEKYYIDI